jgi:thiol:disulfide interchange protein
MENLSIPSYLSLSFSFGLLSLLTPCVFPLIPITVSYFTKRQESEHAKPALDAFLYSLGIILSFSIVGFLIAALFVASGLNRLASNPYMNILIALVFIVFAFNLFGMFEILVSSSLLTKLSNFQSKNNLLSIWVMSFTFTLTTFTCTMPFIADLNSVILLPSDFARSGSRLGPKSSNTITSKIIISGIPNPNILTSCGQSVRHIRTLCRKTTLALRLNKNRMLMQELLQLLCHWLES